MINNHHPKGSKEYKNWNKVIVMLLVVGVIIGFVVKSIKTY